MKIAIVEPSAIVRSGLESLLRKLPGLRIQLVEVVRDSLQESLRAKNPDILIINPAVPGYLTARRLKEDSGCEGMKCVALLYALADEKDLLAYDERISIYDSADEIRHKLERLTEAEGAEEDPDELRTLSAREKEIVVCVVKGLTNREIADRLYLSTHTVLTHRRNIARKLQIHSASGLTVYAIVNKLVELSEIKR